jgi:hypothetical protein
VHAWVLPEQVSIPQAWEVFDSAGKSRDKLIERRLQELGRQVSRFAYLHASDQAREFIEGWENAPTNPGG